MYKMIAGVTALLAMTGPALAQAQATNFTKAQIDAVLKAGPNAVDHTIQVFDMGDYAMSVRSSSAMPPSPGRPALRRPRRARMR